MDQNLWIILLSSEPTSRRRKCSGMFEVGHGLGGGNIGDVLQSLEQM